jgi:hypothetical protein
MDIIDKFHNHADECRRMARATHDLATKAVWNRMADRWLTLAANEAARTLQLSETRARRAQTRRQPRAA